MPIQTTTVSLTVQQQDEDGGAVCKKLPSLPKQLVDHSSYSIRRYNVAPGETGLALDVSGAVGVLAVSHDNPFDIKLGAGDAAVLEDQVEFVAVGQVANGTMGTGVAPVLIGNGSSTASVEVWTFYA